MVSVQHLAFNLFSANSEWLCYIYDQRAGGQLQHVENEERLWLHIQYNILHASCACVGH